MEKYKILGQLIRQAREEKGWTQQELAEKMATDVEVISRLEDGNENPSISEAAGFFFLLNISPNIIMYEDNLEDALTQDRIFRELQKLKPEQLDRLYESAKHIMQWRANNSNVLTVEDYWNTLESTE